MTTPPTTGLTFTPGPEVPAPERVNHWRGTSVEKEWRRDWRTRIEQSIRDENPWGLLCTAPDGSVTLRDVVTPGAVWAATEAHSVRLLLRRDTR